MNSKTREMIAGFLLHTQFFIMTGLDPVIFFAAPQKKMPASSAGMMRECV